VEQQDQIGWNMVMEASDLQVIFGVIIVDCLNNNLKILPVFLLSFVLVSGLGLASNCQTKGNYKVCFYEIDNGISHHVWNISIEDLSGPPPSSINISSLIDSTNFPASKVRNAKLYTLENTTYTTKVFDHYKYVNGTLHNNGTLTLLQNGSLSWNVGNNSTVLDKTKVYDYNLIEGWWTENESQAVYRNEQKWKWKWQKAKEQYFKRNAKRFTQGMGTFKVSQNPKWFRYEFDTPVQFWSKGRFALNLNNIEFDPWWNSTWKHRREVNFTEQSGNDLTNYPVEYWFPHNGKAQADCDDVRVIAPDGSEVEFNSTGCNSTHVKLAHKIDVSASSSVDYSIYYDNPDATQSAKEISYNNARYNIYDDFNDGTIDPHWKVSYAPNGNDFTESGGVLYHGPDYDTDIYWNETTFKNLNLSGILI